MAAASMVVYPRTPWTSETACSTAGPLGLGQVGIREERIASELAPEQCLGESTCRNGPENSSSSACCTCLARSAVARGRRGGMVGGGDGHVGLPDERGRADRQHRPAEVLSKGGAMTLPTPEGGGLRGIAPELHDGLATIVGGDISPNYYESCGP